MKIQKCSHSYSDESRQIDCYVNYLSYDSILNFLGGSSATLSGNIAKACMMDKEHKMFAFKNLSFRMVTQIQQELAELIKADPTELKPSF